MPPILACNLYGAGMIHTTPTHSGLYRPAFEKDGCGFGLIAQMDGQPSHWLIQTAVTSLTNLTHRGAIAPDGKSGDGCGLLMRMPEAFLLGIALAAGIALSPLFAVGMVFLNRDRSLGEGARLRLSAELAREGLSVAGWRAVPTNPDACGPQALETAPRVEQVFVNAPDGMDDADFASRLFMARRRAEKALEMDDPVFYVASLSSRIIVYKGLVMPANLKRFYPDLADERMESSLCVFHQRFSTNTLPQWRLAQPFRLLAHNGEINTIQGNRNWSVTRARGRNFANRLLPGLHDVLPIVRETGSDSESLDNMLELLVTGGIDVFRAMRMLMPPAWQNDETMDADLRAFYQYHSFHQEPWDGPAGIVLTDGRYAVCILDRNGLRPARYVITRDRHITLASEIGVYGYAPHEVASKGRLGPGQMIAADTKTGRLLLPEQIDELLKCRRPYKRWLDRYCRRIEPSPAAEAEDEDFADRARLQVFEKLFQVTFEERDHVLRVLAASSQEALGSMGDDTPLAVLSRRPRTLYEYFRQQFAQVTNPPIDPLRERIVMSLDTNFGPELNIFNETPEHARCSVTDSPVLSRSQFREITGESGPYPAVHLDLLYDEGMRLQEAITRLCDRAATEVRVGKVVLVLSDRRIARHKLPIHATLATGAVHHRLIDEGLRCRANIVVETATARDPHHFAVLLGYGATAVYPYLAYAVLRDLMLSGELKIGDAAECLRNYRLGIVKGLYKIISRMGISTMASYRGAQLFEAVGLHEAVVDVCFRGTVSRIGGADFADLESDQRELAQQAWNTRKPIQAGGLLKYMFDGEYHAYNPDVVQALQRAVQTGDPELYRAYARLVNERPVTVLRDLLDLRSDAAPIALDDVEPVEAILQRFDSAGMSLGALSPEAHETLAIAMNRLGGRSNSGEGGEDPARYGTEKMSKIKQVASARFGVTPAYLTNAEVLQIKIAQGAKPGEGGQLPGDKVDELIARLRYAKVGVSLISPPPHHDIYSIEDLAQLIFDLKQVNPRALVSVKLVAEAGVGTIAAGVAKAYADLITIAGYDGGTGASPLTSVKYAGSPWELGLAETHGVLRDNKLRHRVRLQIDGGLKTGLDVVKAAILGAESFGFGTGPLIAMGCKYLRLCHLNSCATGVATQNETLRRGHFIGLPEMVMNYFRFIAAETREWMARLGVSRLIDLIGRTDLLELLPGTTSKQQRLDLTGVLGSVRGDDRCPRYCEVEHNEPFDRGELAERMVSDALPAIESGSGGEHRYSVSNVHRSIGARLSGEIARRWGDRGMADHPITVRLTGTAGQSFGVWNVGGLHLYLEGDANDYVGKGMAGGKLVIYPHRNSRFHSQQTPIIGNTCLYGATGGKFFASGLAGERFAVRNSGATAVVEGIGDHGCEYMTGGTVVVLGRSGHNFGAGMTGGSAYVLDLDGSFVRRCNAEFVGVVRLTAEHAEAHRNHLRGVVREFVTETGSLWGQHILDEYEDFVSRFWLAKPKAVQPETLVEELLHQ